MENSGVTPQTEAELNEKPKASLDSVKETLGKVNKTINLIGTWLFHLRKLVLAIPVVYYSLRLAAMNGAMLPEQVGIGLQANGTFAMTVGRGFAVMGPLALTLACLLLMFCSRKALYPWAVTMFTLALPWLLLISNLYPA